MATTTGRLSATQQHALKKFFDEKVAAYNQPSFIAPDPISVPHRFSLPQDIEIAGFFAAIFAWGNRTTIIAKSLELMQRMDNAPYQFLLHHSPADLKGLASFKHRTFTPDDLYYFIERLQAHYRQHNSLEAAFAQGMLPGDTTIENALKGFHRLFFDREHMARTRKHVSTPHRNSSCKRLCMYLRWMVRSDKAGVDFGLWKTLQPAQLVCPVDLHVARVARRFGLMHRKQPDWQAALELTDYLRQLHPTDPVRYDFALFGLGVIEKYA